MKIAHSERLLKAAREVVEDGTLDQGRFSPVVETDPEKFDALRAVVAEIDRELKGDKL